MIENDFAASNGLPTCPHFQHVRNLKTRWKTARRSQRLQNPSLTSENAPGFRALQRQVRLLFNLGGVPTWTVKKVLHNNEVAVVIKEALGKCPTGYYQDLWPKLSELTVEKLTFLCEYRKNQ